jgi:hypothetical protein
LEDKAEELPQH